MDYMDINFNWQFWLNDKVSWFNWNFILSVLNAVFALEGMMARSGTCSPFWICYNVLRHSVITNEKWPQCLLSLFNFEFKTANVVKVMFIYNSFHCDVSFCDLVLKCLPLSIQWFSKTKQQGKLFSKECIVSGENKRKLAKYSKIQFL